MAKKPTQSSPIQGDPIQSEPREVLPMKVEAKIHALHTSGAVLADASVNLNCCFAIRGVKVVNGSNGPFVSMPSYKTRGQYEDVCFPCTKEFHQQFHQAVLDAYQQELALLPQRHQETAGQDMAPPAPEMKM